MGFAFTESLGSQNALSLPLLMVYLMVKLCKAQHHEREVYFTAGSDIRTLILLVLMQQESKSCFPTQNHRVIDPLGHQAQVRPAFRGFPIHTSPLQNQSIDLARSLLCFFPSPASQSARQADSSSQICTQKCPV